MEIRPPCTAKVSGARGTAERCTYDVVVLAADRGLGAGRANASTDDGERAALETDLASNVRGVDAEEVKEGGDRRGVRLEKASSTRKSRMLLDTRTSWTELQHWMSPVLQLSRRRTVGVATAKRGRARREKAAARANIVKECGGLGKE